ncbi:MAG: 30S ribosomal protein S20 [Alphaproteobacteria bacterium]
MANHRSAKKRSKRNASRSKINSSRVSNIRTSLKKVEQAIQSGNAKAAEDALKKVRPQIARGVSKGILKKSTASRKISRLSARIKNLKKTAKG